MPTAISNSLSQEFDNLIQRTKEIYKIDFFDCSIGNTPVNTIIRKFNTEQFNHFYNTLVYKTCQLSETITLPEGYDWHFPITIFITQESDIDNVLQYFDVLMTYIRTNTQISFDVYTFNDSSNTIAITCLLHGAQGTDLDCYDAVLSLASISGARLGKVELTPLGFGKFKTTLCSNIKARVSHLHYESYHGYLKAALNNYLHTNDGNIANIDNDWLGIIDTVRYKDLRSSSYVSYDRDTSVVLEYLNNITNSFIDLTSKIMSCDRNNKIPFAHFYLYDNLTNKISSIQTVYSEDSFINSVSQFAYATCGDYIYEKIKIPFCGGVKDVLSARVIDNTKIVYETPYFKIGGECVNALFETYRHCDKMLKLSEDFYIPRSVEYLIGTFEGCSSLSRLSSNFYLHSDVKSINRCFNGCTALRASLRFDADLWELDDKLALGANISIYGDSPILQYESLNLVHKEVIPENGKYIVWSTKQEFSVGDKFPLPHDCDKYFYMDYEYIFDGKVLMWKAFKVHEEKFLTSPILREVAEYPVLTK